MFRTNDALRLRPATIAMNNVAYATHILPTFGNVQLAKITQPLIQSWVTGLTVSGLAPSSVRHYYLALHKSLAAAVSAGLLARNPCVDIRLPRVEVDEMRFLSPAELALLADTIAERYRALIFVAGYSGLRIGELAGLRKKAVDLDKGVVSVVASVTEVRGHVSVGPPKTRAAVRRVPIPVEVTSILEGHMADHGVTSPDDFVFQGAQGGVLRPPAWRARVFGPAVERAGLAPLRPHDLRHTAIAIWIAAGVPAKEIAVRAGHTSAPLVLDRYGHLFPESDDAFRDRVSKLFTARGASTSAAAPTGTID